MHSFYSKTIVFVTILLCFFANIASSQIITTVAGNGYTTPIGNGGYSGDGGTATSAELNWPTGVAVDALGNIYIADEYNNRIRKIDASGVITTVAGNGTRAYSGDGGAAISASLFNPTGVTVDAAGNIYIADYTNNRIRKVNTSGVITTVAGGGITGVLGDGGPATNASLFLPFGVAVDAAGNIYIADEYNNRIRKVDTRGVINTVAGNGTQGYSGDGGLAISASLYNPLGVAVDAAGNIYIADQNNNRIRKVNTSGVISTVAGNGDGGYSGDGGPATSASIYTADGVAVDAAGNIYIADYGNNRIRKVNTNGVINTVAGNGKASYSGDGGAATNASLASPEGVAVDTAGNIYIADYRNFRIRKVTFGAPRPPSILSFTPNGTCPGTSTPVLILGTNFTGTTAVTVGGGAVDSFTVNSSNSITAYISKGNTGKIAVTNDGVTDTSDSVFTFGMGHTANAYVPNYDDNTVSVINTTTNTLVATIAVGTKPYGVSISPDGTKAYVTNYGSNNVSIINTTTNAVTSTISVGNNPTGIIISNDGTKLYVVNNNNKSNGSVSVVNTLTNAVTANIAVGSNPYGITITPDGKTIYVSNWNDNDVDIINTQTGLLIEALGIGVNPSAVTINHDGTLVYVANNASANVSVINTATNTANTFANGNGPSGICFSPDGSKVYVSNDLDGTVNVFKTSNFDLITTVAVGNFPQGLSVTPDGLRVYVSNYKDGTVSVINTINNTVETTVKIGASPVSFGNFVANVPTQCGTPPPPSNPPTILSFTPNGTCPGTSIPVFITGSNFKGATAVTVGGTAVDSFTVNDSSSITAYISKGTTGKIAVTNGSSTATSDSTFNFGLGHTAYAYITSNGSNSIYVVNVAADTVTTTIPVGLNTSTISVSPDGTRAYIQNTTDMSISVINTLSNTLIGKVSFGATAGTVFVSPDGKKIYVANYGDVIMVIDAATLKVIDTLSLPGETDGLAMSPDSKTLYVTNTTQNAVGIIDVATKTLTSTITVGSVPIGIVLSADGSTLYVSNKSDNTVSVINVSTGLITSTIQVGSSPISLCLSMDGTKLYTSNDGDNTVSVIDLIKNVAIASVEVGYSPWGISISPDGSKVYVANSGDGTASVINTANNTVIATVPIGSNPGSYGNFVANVPSPCSTLPPPIITSFDTSACPGTTDTIKGSNFTYATSVLFGKEAASSFKVINDSTIAAIVDSGASGSVQVITTSGTASVGGFIYLAPTASTTDSSICQGGSVTFNGKTYNATGIYNAHLLNSVGCDSTATLVLTIKFPSQSTTDTIICFGTSYAFNGKQYDTTGTYVAHLINSVGCDSAATLALTVIKPDSLYPIVGDSIFCINTSITLTDATAKGVWSSLNNTVATVSGGIVAGLNADTTTISYADTSRCGHTTFHKIQVLGVMPQVDSTITPATCDNTSGGIINVAINGIENPYQIAFEGVKIDAPYTIPNLPVGSYSLAIYNYAGCKVDTMPILLVNLTEDGNCDTLYVPTGFVPTSNANGYIGKLKPFGGGSSVLTITFKVYNRFGGLVFESHNLNDGWDGTINGTLQDTGSYVWYLEYTTINNKRKQAKGISTLIR